MSPKTCTFDCVYCEVGATCVRTLNRREYSPVAEVLAEFRQWISIGEKADYVTLSGSGEPTLHSRFGEILQEIRGIAPLPTALLSNGSLFFLPDVRRDAALASVVKLTVSSWDQRSFERLHRPHPDLRFERIIEGMTMFGTDYKGELWVEVFLVAGVNDEPGCVAKIAEIVRKIRPKQVHLNTLARPGTDRSVRSVNEKSLHRLASLFDPPALLIQGFHSGATGAEWDEKKILAMLARRPCPVAEIAALAGVSEDCVAGILADLERRGLVRRTHTGDCWVSA